MIFHIRNPFSHNGKEFKPGDTLTAEEHAEIVKTPNAYNVLPLPDDAKGRLEMADVAPNKPIGSVKSPVAGNLPEGSVLPEPPPAYVGGDEAKGVIENPSPDERQLDAHPDATTEIPQAVKDAHAVPDAPKDDEPQKVEVVNAIATETKAPE